MVPENMDSIVQSFQAVFNPALLFVYEKQIKRNISKYEVPFSLRGKTHKTQRLGTTHFPLLLLCAGQGNSMKRAHRWIVSESAFVLRISHPHRKLKFLL